MKKTMKYLLPALMILAGLSLHVAKGQIDPGDRIYLIENGARMGEVYVPDRAPGETKYVEDWVLYPKYRYPGPSFLGILNVAVSTSERPYSSPADFFQNVPFAAGSKYVRVTAEEFTSLPVAR